METTTGSSSTDRGVKSGCVAACDKLRIFRREHVPAWMDDNPHILSGFRWRLSWRMSLKSACHLHNETFNVWTHLVAFMTMFTLLLFTMSTLSPYGVDWMKLNVLRAKWQTVEVFNVPQPDMDMQQCPLREEENPKVHRFQHSDRTAMLNNTPPNWSFQYMVELSENMQRYITSHNRVTAFLKEKAEEFQHVASREHFLEYLAHVQASVQNSTDAIKAVMAETRLESHQRVESIRSHLQVSAAPYLDILQARVDVMDIANAILEEFAEFAGQSSNVTTKGRHYSMFTLSPHQKLQNYLPLWPLAVFCLSAMGCLFASSMFHLFLCISPSVCETFQAADYAGISLLITGSTLPLVYYGFFCQPALRTFYIVVCSGIGLTGFLLSIAPKYRHVRYRGLRAGMFVVIGASGMIPLSHLFVQFGEIHWIMGYVLCMGLLYIGGAVIYVFQFPEKMFPGKFDIFFSSHQLWHVCIIIAVMVHYMGLLAFYEWRMTTACPLH